jgi:hypothetical protein
MHDTSGKPVLTREANPVFMLSGSDQHPDGQREALESGFQKYGEMYLIARVLKDIAILHL